MGVCGDLGVHKADLMRYLLGEEFTEVTGFIATRDKKDPKTGKPISVEDNAFITMKTRSGVLGTMTIELDQLWLLGATPPASIAKKASCWSVGILLLARW